MLGIFNRRHHYVARYYRLALVSFLLTAAFGWAQTPSGSGSIVGLVSGPSGTVANTIKITVASLQTGQSLSLTPNGDGIFHSGALLPGRYDVQVATKGFRTIHQTLEVHSGNITMMSVALEPGNEKETVEVASAEATIDAGHSNIQGVLSASRIEDVPVSGRNIFDLAQLEPGAQPQDGQNLAPTKAGYSYISLEGLSGRKTRMTLDGVDVQDEITGASIQSVPASAIEEVQTVQSLASISDTSTSTGSIHLTTRSGTNAIHGGAFGTFSDHSLNAVAPGGVDLPFQRSQYGAFFGGPLIKSKLFFFLDAERVKQDALTPVRFSAPFDGLSGSFNQPFRQNNLLGRLDYNLQNGARVFYRFTYFAVPSPSNFGQGFSTYESKNHARNQEGGIDFRTGAYTHSIRASYLNLNNQILDTVSGNTSLISTDGLSLASSNGFYAGLNPQTAQNTRQSSYQFKYDGARVYRNHVIHFGVSYGRIQAARFANLYGSAPQVLWNTGVGAGTLTNPQTGSEVWFAQNAGGISDPLNYPVETVLVGNGLGYSTGKAALGLPAGGVPTDNPIGAYAGGNWRIRRNITLNYGVRYERNTGLTNSDLPAISALNTAFSGFGNRVRQPNFNFAPQVGFAWDPNSSGRTSVRGGIGLFYEHPSLNNVLADRQYRLATGTFNHVSRACFNGIPQPVTTTELGVIRPAAGVCSQALTLTVPLPTPHTVTVNGGPISITAAASSIVAFAQQLITTDNVQSFTAANPNYLGNYMANGLGVPLGVYAPNYRTPRSLQINFGIQHEFGRGYIFSMDYLRNIETHSLLGVDMNHVGDSTYFSLTDAQLAIQATLSACNATTIDQAINSCLPLHPTGAQGATMADFARFGLTSSTDFGGYCIPTLGHPCAFGGKNPNQGQAFFLSPVGRSVYSGLQFKLGQNVAREVGYGVRIANFQLAYTFSRSKGSGGAQSFGTMGENDQSSIIQAADNNRVNRYYGPTLMDRTHQFSLSGHADGPFGLHLGLMAHLYSPLSASLIAPASGSAGEIFRTDFTGDGTTQDPLPTTTFGNFGRKVRASGLNRTLTDYNNTRAGAATPAGAVLIQNNLMNLGQLQALGGVVPRLSVGPATPAGFSWLKEVDLKLSWRHTVRERLTLEPSVSFYNAFNFSNFNLPSNMLNSLLTGAPGSLNGTATTGNDVFRAGNGSGVNSQGVARQLEFGFRMTF